MRLPPCGPLLCQANGSLPAACDCAYGPISLGLPRFTHGVVRHDLLSSLAATGSDAALGLKFDPVKTIAKVVARLMEIINVVVVMAARKQKLLPSAQTLLASV